MTSNPQEMKRQYPKLLGLLLVFASVLAIVALYALDITFFYEPKFLVGVTNTFFTAIIPLVVAFFAAKTYLRTGSSGVLLMGCGMLGFGLCAGSSGWLRELPGGANFNVTIYNIGALLGSLCHFAGAIISFLGKSYRQESGKRKPAAIPAYSAIILFAVLISLATVQHVIPPLIQGSGPTAIRQIVLGLAIFLYALSSLFFMNGYLRTKSDFLYWYSLCLAMLAVGLFAFSIEKIVGCPLGWVGRSSNYVGTIFSLIAIHAAVRSGKSGGPPLAEVISGFFTDAEANYRSLIETATDAIISFDQDNRIILWNSSAEKIFGYTKAEATGSPIFGKFITEEHAKSLKELVETSRGTSSQNTVEIEGRHKNGGLFPVELSAFARELPNGRVSTCILRDITERRQAEKNISHQISIMDGINRIFREALAADTEEDLGRTCLEVAEELTKSKFGFIGEIGSDGFLHDIAISDPGWELCEMYDKTGHRRPPGDFEIHGLYGRVLLDGKSLLTNNPAEHPGSIGTPFGHPNLNAFLGVPLILDGRTIGMIAVGNRDGGYSQADMEALEALSPTVVEAFARKRAEEALSESKAKLEAALASMTDAVFISDAEGLFVNVNEAFATFLKFKNKNEYFKTFAEYPEVFELFIAGKQAPPEMWPVKRALSGETAINAEYTLRRKDTGETWIGSHNFAPLRDKDGVIVGSVVTGRDVTERRQAEETLRTAMQLFHAILSDIFSGILVVTEDDRIEFANRAFCDQFGIAEAPSDLIGMTAGEMLQKILPAYADPEALARIQHIVSQSNRIQDEEVLMRDGRMLLRDYVPILIDGKQCGRMWQHRDITERKRVETELRESRSRLDLALRSAQMGVWHLDLTENKRHYDDQVCHLLGIDPAKFTGTAKEFYNAVHPDDREMLKAALARNIEQNIPYETEYRAVWPDGSVHYILARAKLFRNEAGRPVRVDGLIWDITDHKLAMAALLESRTKLEASLASMTDAVFISDAEGRFIHFNDAFATYHRFKNKDECMKTLAEYPDILDVFMADGQLAPLDQWAVSRALRGETVTNAEYTLRRKDTGETWVGSYSFGPIRDKDGEIIGSVVAGRDITEIKRAEEELHRAHDELELRVRERTNELVIANEDLQRQAALLDLAHDAIFVVDPADVVSFWNKGAEDLYGFTGEQAIGNIASELLHTRFPESLEQVVNQVIDKGEWTGELTHTTSSGKALAVESRWALRQGEDGELLGFLEVNRDITARKIAEEEFRKADRAFRTLSEFNQAMVRQTDEMELLRQLCQIVADVGGYQLVWVGFAENDENKSVVPIASAGHDDGYLARARITWADNERGQGPCGISIRTGKMSVSQNAESNPAFAPWRFEAAQRGIASSISLPLIVEGHVIGALGIYASEPDAFDEEESSLLSNLAENLSYGIGSIRTAEQRRRSGEELRGYASRLELINRELQDFAFVASHDLQEPLRKIQTFCDMAQKRCAPVLDATSQDYLDRVVKSASRMRQLLHDLLQFSRVATRPEPFKKIDLVKVAREAADVFEASVREKGCRIEIEDIPAIEADESQMSRLFQNLIGNALKFRGSETPHVKVYGKLDSRGICELFVKDNGIGFDPKYAQLIFKPFQRLHGRSEYEGTGMGLAICRKIVERHGGNIRAESKPGKGSTFIIRLPAKQVALETIIA